MNPALFREHVVSAVTGPFVRLTHRLLQGPLVFRPRPRPRGHPNRRLGVDWRWGNSLRSVHPIRRACGWQAGPDIHRFYTDELFFPCYADDIQGRVLEIGDNRYTTQFGGAKVNRSDVLHVTRDHPNATVIDDLTVGTQLSSNSFDCVILTFTLQCIADSRAAIGTVHRILKPGGVLLLAEPTLNPIARYDDDRWGDYWRFTSTSLRRLLTEVFEPTGVTVRSYGNLLTAVALLHGIIARELTREELTFVDGQYEVTVTARAQK
jgi:SAM-dependent methyltransferase